MTIHRPVISRSALLLLATVGLAIEVNAQSVPEPPSSLSANVTGTTVTLLWAPSAVGGPAQAYVVEVGSAPGASNLMRFSTGSPATTLVGTGVAAGTYYVRIRGLNSSGESGPSNEIAVTVGSVPQSVPEPPASLSASVTGTTVTLLWAPSAVGGPAQAYVVEVGSAPGASNLMRFSTGSPATTLVGTGVAAGTYYVRIRGLNSSGESGPSNEIAVTVGSVCGSPPTAPGPLVSSVSGSSVQLSWGGSSGTVSTYVFEIGSFSGSTNLGTMELGSAATTFATSGVAPGTYFVRVKARNPCGLSAPSNDAVVNVGQPTGPTGPARLEIVNLREYTIVGGSDGGDRAFAAELINTGGSTASKVTMNVDVYYPDGRRYYGTFSEVSGRTRRLVSSNALSHSTLAPGESTCISAVLTSPDKLGRYTVKLNSETEPTAPALGQLELKGSWYVNNTFGLVVGAEMTNVGPIRTVDQRAQFMAKDAAGLVVRCGTIPVFGKTRTTFPGFAGTVSQLLPGERGFSDTTPSYDWENVKSITSITFWPRWRE